jgi:fumarate reductase flavoprotein subunit
MVKCFKRVSPGYKYSISGSRDREGDGLKMGIWAGATVDELPHGCMQFDSAVSNANTNPVGWPFSGAGSGWRQPFLHVNIRGKRYVNEDLPYQYQCNAVHMQPGHLCGR